MGTDVVDIEGGAVEFTAVVRHPVCDGFHNRVHLIVGALTGGGCHGDAGERFEFDVFRIGIVSLHGFLRLHIHVGFFEFLIMEHDAAIAGVVGNQMQRGCFADQHAPKHPFHLIGGNRHANRGGIALREGLKDSSRNSGTGVVFCGETKYNKPAHKRVFHIKESYKRDFLYAYERRTIYNSKHSIHFVW